MRETTIRMTPDAITLELVNDNGMRSIKNTNLETVQNILAADQRFETPLLPGQWGIQKYMRKDADEYFVYTEPAGFRDVQYDYRSNDVEEEASFTIPVPATLWLIHVRLNVADNSRRLNSTMAYAIKNPILSEDDMLFKMPFSNVSGQVCWGGSSSTPAVSSAKSIQSLPTQFFLRPFNNDLGDNRFRTFPDGRPGKEGVNIFRVQHLFAWLHENLQAARAESREFGFPNERLVQVGTLRNQTEQYFGF